MIYWITGRSSSGKTTLARKIAKQINGIVLDGDDLRKHFRNDDFGEIGRVKNQVLLTLMAKDLEHKGKNVVISCISPCRTTRKKLQDIFKECIEIQLPYGYMWEGTEYEE